MSALRSHSAPRAAGRLRALAATFLVGAALAAGAQPPASQPAAPRPTATPRNPPAAPRAYEPTLASVRRHPLPAWFEDAKFGIFVHWDLGSYPGWAETPGSLDQILADTTRGWRYWFAHNPYSDWYYNTIRIPGSGARAYHDSTYGADVSYFDFAPRMREAMRAWRPDDWATLFTRAGARYVVLTTKHHDGFLLWPSRTPNPFHRDYGAARDVVGELATAVRGRGLRYGLYYSGGIDWTFNDTVIRDFTDLRRAVPQDSAYVRYAEAHVKELVERYRPSVLWNDIAWPAASDPNAIFAHYYQRVPDGVVNDRFVTNPAQMMDTGRVARHFDFSTPEYAVEGQLTTRKWEATRGIGYSFGYNRNETGAESLTLDALVDLFADAIAKNGNLLLNVGPMADGTIPPGQRRLLEAMGDWLRTNARAVYGTRPCGSAFGTAPLGAEATTSEGGRVRFTCRGGAAYAFLLDVPRGDTVLVPGLRVAAGTRVTSVGDGARVSASGAGDTLRLVLGQRGRAAGALALAFDRAPVRPDSLPTAPRSPVSPRRRTP
jgi:alpha-L-fucosidase